MTMTAGLAPRVEAFARAETQVLNVDPRTDRLWGELVERRWSDAFHAPGWVRVLTDTYGFDAHALVLVDGSGVPAAGVAYCEIDDVMGPRIASLPFSDFCDPLVSDSDQWGRLAGELLDRGLPVAVRCLHNRIPLEDGRFTVVKQAKWHGLDLRPGLDALWGGLHESSRRAIRKARQSGVAVRVARGEEDLRVFFEMHLRVRKHKYRLLAQPYRFFQNIWRRFVEAQSGLLMLAEHGGRIVGGVLFLEWKDGLYYKFNASCAEDLPFRPNDLLMWEGIQYGKAQGFTRLDLGLSDWDQEGLIRYKRKYATEEKTISFLRYEPAEASSPQTQHVRRLMPQLTDLFTDASVPDRVTEQAGEVLYRFFV
jgi:CelD/BcsL family acetyltransferase involved in cellulose biosynthesis